MHSSEALNPPGSVGAARQLAGACAGPADSCELACMAAPLEVAQPALQLTHEQLQEVVAIMSAHHQGTVPGPSGWTIEMMCASCQSADTALDVTLDVTLELVNLILSWKRPREAFSLDGLLIGLEKSRGGVQPIAISETWYRFPRVCTLRTYGRGIGDGLAPLQMRVGTSAGTETVVS